MRLFVANINYDATEADLRDFFVAGGYIPSSVRICLDRDTQRPRGFAFVEMQESWRQAIEDMNGQEFMGRDLAVREATPRGGESRFVGASPDGGRYAHR
jgi:RNA recognition motif-containing protein